MTTSKKPIRISDIFAEPEQVELPNGRIAAVRPIDAIGYDMYLQLEADPGANARNIWDIVGRCLPTVPAKEIRELTVPECTAVLAIAVGRIVMVQELAAEMGKATAPNPAEPTRETPQSSTLPGLSSSESPAS